MNISKNIIKNIGLGIDIEDVNRFKKLDFFKKKRFFEKIYLDSEVDFCNQMNPPHLYFATIFSIKEATIKALGSIGVHNIFRTDISTFQLNSKIQIKIKHFQNSTFLIDTSNADRHVIASCMILSSAGLE